MKRHATKFSAFIAAALLMLGVASCTEETTTGPGDNNNTGAATGLKANSPADGQIRVAWVRASTDTGPDTVTATPVPPYTGTGATAIAASNSSKVLLSGLTTGTPYSIVVHNGASSTPLQWAPAVHSAVIRLWETSDNRPNHPSGLVLNPNDPNGGIHAVSVSAGAPERDNADLILYHDESVPTSMLSLISPAVLAGRLTHFAKNVHLVQGGMAEDYYGSSILDSIPPANPAADLTDPTGVYTAADFAGALENNQGLPAVILLQTVDNYFARIEIIPQPNGKLYATEQVGATLYAYIDVKVSAQPTQALGYVARPHMRYGTLPKRNMGTVFIKN